MSFSLLLINRKERGKGRGGEGREEGKERKEKRKKRKREQKGERKKERKFPQRSGNLLRKSAYQMFLPSWASF